MNGGSQTWFLKNPKSSNFGEFFYHVFKRKNGPRKTKFWYFSPTHFAKNRWKKLKTSEWQIYQEKWKFSKKLFFHRNQFLLAIFRKISKFRFPRSILTLKKITRGKKISPKFELFGFFRNQVWDPPFIPISVILYVPPSKTKVV